MTNIRQGNPFAPFASDDESTCEKCEAELRTLRARAVVELEVIAARERGAAIVEINLRARAESAEARVKELEAEVESEHRLYTGALDYGQARITDLESQLAAAREEQGLEERLKQVLGWRLGTLQLKGRRTLSWHAHWHGGSSIDEGSSEERAADAKTLPALLRAILEVEARS